MAHRRYVKALNVNSITIAAGAERDRLHGTPGIRARWTAFEIGCILQLPAVCLLCVLRVRGQSKTLRLDLDAAVRTSQVCFLIVV